MPPKRGGCFNLRRISNMMNKENTALQMIAEAARCPDYALRS